jgi:hypothetical protein
LPVAITTRREDKGTLTFTEMSQCWKGGSCFAAFPKR